MKAVLKPQRSWSAFLLIPWEIACIYGIVAAVPNMASSTSLIAITGAWWAVWVYAATRGIYDLGWNLVGTEELELSDSVVVWRRRLDGVVVVQHTFPLEEIAALEQEPAAAGGMCVRLSVRGKKYDLAGVPDQPSTDDFLALLTRRLRHRAA